MVRTAGNTIVRSLLGALGLGEEAGAVRKVRVGFKHDLTPRLIM